MGLTEYWNLGLPFQLIIIVVFIGVVPVSIYPIIIAFLKWNRTPIGRSMMFNGVALFLVFAQGILGLYFGLGFKGWWPWVILGVNTWLAFAVWYQFIVLIGTLRKRKGKKPEGREDLKLPEEPE